MSTTGIVTGIVAVGAAAVYAAYQFLKSSTTVEQAIAKQKQLLKETKTAIDDLITAQIRLESTDLKRFESIRNEQDLRVKLNRAVKEAAEIGAGIGNIPLIGVLGPGFEKINAAAATLNAAIAAGRPDLVGYNDELGKIGEQRSRTCQDHRENAAGQDKKVVNLERPG